MATHLLSSITLLGLCIVQYFDLTSLALPESQCHSNDKGWDYLHLRRCRRSMSHMMWKSHSAATTLPNTQRQPESPSSWFCMWDKTWLGIVPVCIKPADKRDGLMPWWSKPSGGAQREEGQVLEQMLSATTFPLSCQYHLCFLQPLPGSQQSPRNVERFVCHLGNDTEAFGLCRNALCSLEVHRIFLWFPG